MTEYTPQTALDHDELAEAIAGLTDAECRRALTAMRGRLYWADNGQARALLSNSIAAARIDQSASFPPPARPLTGVEPAAVCELAEAIRDALTAPVAAGGGYEAEDRLTASRAAHVCGALQGLATAGVEHLASATTTIARAAEVVPATYPLAGADGDAAGGES